MSTSAALPELTGHDDADLLIGDVARHSGLSIDTLRYYDRAGLLGAVNRDGGGRRVFDRDTLGLLDVVLRLRRTGMPVEDVRHFVDLVRSGDTERALPSQDQVMAVCAVSQCLQGLLRLQEEHVITRLELAAVGQPAPDLDRHAVHQCERGTHGEVLVVLAHRVRGRGMVERPVELGQRLR
jgi:DNA-binding transcriptional MerR regulator